MFLSAFHNARLAESAKLVEDEQWNQVEVSLTSQRFVDVLIESAVSDPPELQITTDEQRNAALSGSTSGGGETEKQKGAKHLLVEERDFYAVSATTKVLGLVLEYLKIIVNLPLLTTDAMSRVIEFLKVSIIVWNC